MFCWMYFPTAFKRNTKTLKMGTTASHCESKKKQLESDVSHFQHYFYIRILLFSLIPPFFSPPSFRTLKCCFSLVNYSCLHIGAFGVGQEITSAVLANLTESVAWTSVNNFKIAYTGVDLQCFSCKDISGLFMFPLWEVQLIFSILIYMSQVVNTEKGKLSEAELVHTAHRTKQALGQQYCPQPTLTPTCSGWGHGAAQWRARCWYCSAGSFQEALQIVCMVEDIPKAFSPRNRVGTENHSHTSRQHSVLWDWGATQTPPGIVVLLHAWTCCPGLEPSCQRCVISTASRSTHFIPRWLHQIDQHFDFPPLRYTRTLLLPAPWKPAGSHMRPHCCLARRVSRNQRGYVGSRALLLPGEVPSDPLVPQLLQLSAAVSTTAHHSSAALMLCRCGHVLPWTHRELGDIKRAHASAAS